MIIDVLSTFGPKAAAFSEGLVKSIEKYASGNHTFRYFGVQVGHNSTNPKYKILANIPDVYVAKNHGVALNNIQQDLDYKSDYIMICDPDIAFCKQNFDDYLIKLMDSNYIERGDPIANYGVIGGNTNGVFDKHNNFPSIAFQFYDTRVFQKIHPDFSYMKSNENDGSVYYEIVDEFNSSIYSKAIGEKFQTDVGWSLPKQMDIACGCGITRWSWLCFDRITDIKSHGWIWSEGWIDENDELILKHLGKSCHYNEASIKQWIESI